MSAAPGPVPGAIQGYHAHVYFDADTRDPARRVREAVLERFTVDMGRWWEKPVGPHPCWSYQIAFKPELFPEIVPWLMQHAEGLTVFIHPESGDELRDHRDFALWIGKQVDLKLAMFEKDRTAA